jgi:hypothetical protein
MSKESNNIRKLTPAEELKALLSEDPKAKKKMQKIFSLIDKSANIDDQKFNQELSKAKKLAYEKGVRIDYNPQEGFRDLSVVTELGNKLDKNKYKPVSVEEIKNIIETAPNKKPSYYKQDEQEKGAVTNHESVDRHSDETLLSSSSINKAKEILKTQPTKSALKKQVDSIDNPKPKKTFSFGDENGLKIDVRETKSKDFSNIKIDYDTLKLGNEKAHATNLEHKLARFVTVLNVGGLRQEIENMVVQYTIAQKNDNVIKNTAAALAKWNVAKDSTLTDVYDQVKTQKDNDVKEDISIYRESIENNLKEKGASKIVIKDVLNEFDKSITQPINSANNKDSIAVLASQGFQKFGDIIGAPPRIDDRTARIKKINQEAEKVQDTPQPKAENNIGSRISELQAENQQIDAELQGIATSKAEKRFGRFNINLIRKERNLKKEKLQNNNLIQGYEKIVQPTLSILARKAQKMFAEVQSDKSLKSTLEKEKISGLIQNKINKIKETSVNPETQTLINDIVKTPEAPQKPQFKPMGQRRPVPARKFPNKGQEQNPQVQTSNAAATAPLTAARPNSADKTQDRSNIQKSTIAAEGAPREKNTKFGAMRGSSVRNAAATEPPKPSNEPAINQNPDGHKPTARSQVPKSKLAEKQASQDSQKIRALRGSVELRNDNQASPALSKSSSLPNIKISDTSSQSTQKPSAEANDIPKREVNAASNARPTSQAKQETVSQTQENASIDALWEKLANRKNTKFLTDGTTQDSPSADKMKAIRDNIGTYKDNIQINNLNSSLKLGPVDENYKNITSKDTKIIELTSKALAEINNGTIEKVFNYLKRIDDIDRGLRKTAAIGANDHILQPLAHKTATKVQELQSERNTNQNKTTIEKAKNIGISMASLINEHAVQKIATSAQAKVNNYRNKKQERGGRS